MTAKAHATQVTLNRRKLLAAGAAGGATLLAGPAFAQDGTGAAEKTERTVSLAFGFTLPFAVPIAVGAQDAADLMGWKFRKLWDATSEFTETGQVDIVRQAINTNTDVLLTGNWTRGDAGAIQEAVDAGIEVVVVNAFSFRDDLSANGIAYVGPDERASGAALATKLIELMGDAAAGDAAIVAGNSAPGSGVTETRIIGISEAVAAHNERTGASLEVIAFPDQSGANAAESVNLYSAQISRLGDRLGAFAVVGGSSSLPSLLAAADAAGLSAETTPIGCWDNDEVIVKALSDGKISFFMDQGNYYQGLLGVLNAWTKLDRSAPQLSIATETGPVEAAQLDQWRKFNEIIAERATAL